MPESWVHTSKQQNKHKNGGGDDDDGGGAGGPAQGYSEQKPTVDKGSDPEGIVPEVDRATLQPRREGRIEPNGSINTCLTHICKARCHRPTFAPLSSKLTFIPNSAPLFDMRQVQLPHLLVPGRLCADVAQPSLPRAVLSMPQMPQGPGCRRLCLGRRPLLPPRMRQVQDVRGVPRGPRSSIPAQVGDVLQAAHERHRQEEALRALRRGDPVRVVDRLGR